MYEINIKGLSVCAIHGVLESEKQSPQPFIFDITAKVYESPDLNDNIGNALDYSKLFEYVKNYVTANSFNLIETLGKNLCSLILLNFDLIEQIKIEVKKPNAPLNGNFEHVSVVFEQRRHTVYLSLGSNLGDKYKNLTSAIQNVKALNHTLFVSVSNFYITSPVGYKEQDSFLNCCVKIRTLLSPFELLCTLKDIEQTLQRKKNIRFGPRTIDLDILLYDSEIINSKDLIIPHPQMLRRKFVLVPLIEIYDDSLPCLFQFKTALESLQNCDTIEPYKA